MNPNGQPRKWKEYPQKGKTLRWYFENVFAPARLTGLGAVHTAYQYRLNLMRFDAFLGRAAKLSDLDDTVVGQLHGWIQREHELSPASAEKLQDNLCSLWRFLFARRIVNVAPTLRKKRAPVKTPTALKPEELSRLWDALGRVPGELAGVPANLWFRSLISVMWDCGERIGALRQTVWSDVDLSGAWIVVRPETRKGGLAGKVSRLRPESVALLRQIIAPRRELVWPWPYATASYLHTIWRDIMRRAGLPNGRQFGFHIVRKSVASYTKLCGGNAQDVLGHSDPRMTQQVYIDERIAPRQYAADVLPPLHQIEEWRAQRAL